MKLMLSMFNLLFFILTTFAQNKEAVLERYRAATGGREKWDELKNIRIIKKGYTMESHPEFKRIRGDSVTNFFERDRAASAVSISTDTLYISKPNKVVSVSSIAKIGQPQNPTGSLIVREYYNGKRLKIEAMGSSYVTTDKARLAFPQNKLEDFFMNQRIIKNGTKLKWVGEQVFQNKTYYVLAGNVENDQYSVNKNKVYWYLFDKESGFLEVMKPEDSQEDHYTIFLNYKRMDGFVFSTRCDAIVHGELIMSIEIIDFKSNFDIPESLLNKF